MTTIETRDGSITIDDKIIEDYRRLMKMDPTTEGLQGITVDSCFINGIDTAKSYGFSSDKNWYEFESVYIYFIVSTARTYEIL